MATPNATQGERVEFSAVNVFAGDNRANQSFVLPVAPDVYFKAQQQPGGMTALCGVPVIAVTLLQNLCGYENFEIAGMRVIGSIVTGMLVAFADGHREANGYEWGLLEGGDHYLSQVSERLDADGTTGTWKLLYGSGNLAGIQGEASYTNHPQPGEKVVRSNLDGYYVLPAKGEPAKEDKG
jgi:hypothetical protein